MTYVKRKASNVSIFDGNGYTDIYEGSVFKSEHGKLKNEINKIKNRGEDNKEMIKKIKSYTRVNRLDRELVVELIDSIYVYDDRNININFNFKNEIEKLQKIIAS